MIAYPTPVSSTPALTDEDTPECYRRLGFVPNSPGNPRGVQSADVLSRLALGGESPGYGRTRLPGVNGRAQ